MPWTHRLSHIFKSENRAEKGVTAIRMTSTNSYRVSDGQKTIDSQETSLWYYTIPLIFFYPMTIIQKNLDNEEIKVKTIIFGKSSVVFNSGI